MKKEYSVPMAEKLSFSISAALCGASSVNEEQIPPTTDKDKDSMNGWSPWQ